MSIDDGDIRVAAMAVAGVAHSGQLYDGEAFLLHPIDVASVAEEFGMGSPHMLAACLLHDVLEDTKVEEEELRELFPASVVDAVVCVTDSTNAELEAAGVPKPHNRAARKGHTYLQLRENRTAVGVKLCDRISNVRASVRLLRRDPSAKNFIRMYQKEHAAFRAALYRRGEYEELWRVLDDMLEQPEHCVMCENQGGPLSVQHEGRVTEHDRCPTCAA